MGHEFYSESQDAISCPSCSAQVSVEEKFCGECGSEIYQQSAEEVYVDSAPETPAPKKKKTGINVSKANKNRAGQLAQERLAKRKIQVKEDAIKGGRIAIMVVAVLTFIYTLWQWISFNNEIANARSNPMMVIDEDVVNQVRMILMAYFGASFLFVGFFFWAKKNPFSACLSALVIYVLSHVIAAVIDPANIARGIILKVIIIITLAKAISKAAELRAIEQEEKG